MGYRRERTLYQLVFEDEDGLEVQVAALDVGTLLDVVEIHDRVVTEGEAATSGSVQQLLDAFSLALHDWNLETDATEDGTWQPVPATLEGIRSQELQFVMKLINAWMEANAGVPAPLDQPSPGGGTSLVASLPMDTSGSRPSSPTPG